MHWPCGCASRGRKRSWREDERILHHDLLPVLGKDLARSISRRQVRDLLDQIAERGAGVIMEAIRQVHDGGPDVEKSRQLYAAFAALLRDGVCAGDTTTTYPVPVLSEIVVGTFSTLMLNWLGIENYPFRARATSMARFLGEALRGRERLVRPAARRRATR